MYKKLGVRIKRQSIIADCIQFSTNQKHNPSVEKCESEIQKNYWIWAQSLPS